MAAVYNSHNIATLANGTNPCQNIQRHLRLPLYVLFSNVKTLKRFTFTQERFAPDGLPLENAANGCHDLLAQRNRLKLTGYPLGLIALPQLGVLQCDRC